MHQRTKDVARQLGLGALNLVLAIGLLVAVRVAAHAAGSAGLTVLVLAAALVLGTYLAGGWWIERRRPAELTDRGAARELASGLGLGVLLFALVVAALWAVGVYHATGWGSAAPLLAGAVAALAGAVIEEVLFRGFLFRLVEVLAGTWWALLATAALFGAAHALNPGATVASSLAIAVEAGVLLGAAYALTGRLWLPIGLHAAWNFTEASLFGLTMSGFQTSGGLIVGTLHGPAILSGGAFGPEASIAAVVIGLAGALVLLRRAVRAGRVRRPAWKREEAGAAPA